MSRNLGFPREAVDRPDPIDLGTTDSFLRFIEEVYNVSSSFESLRTFLKSSYCGEGHSSPGGERSVKGYIILSEYLAASESAGTLEIEKVITKDNLILAKPDLWIESRTNFVRAIEIEPRVPQRHKVKSKVESLKANGADRVLIAIACNPEYEERAMRQIRNRRLLDHCDGIMLIDYTRFDMMIAGEAQAGSLVKVVDPVQARMRPMACQLPRSRLR